MPIHWPTERVVVTGGAGFLGSFVVEELKRRGATEVLVPRSRDYDLVDMGAVKALYRDLQPTIVLHLAARVGGIGANRDNPGKFFYDNLMMGVQLIEVGRQVGLKKLVALGTICAYPKFCPVPFKEEDLWNGYPEETNAPYGLAKKMLLVQSEGVPGRSTASTRWSSSRSTSTARATTSTSATSHVIPALIRKCIEARERGDRQVVVWGTGARLARVPPRPRRRRGGRSTRPSATTSRSRSTWAPASRSTSATWCRSSPATAASRARSPGTGPSRTASRAACSTPRKALAEFGWKAQIGFEEGLAETVAWFEENRGQIK